MPGLCRFVGILVAGGLIVSAGPLAAAKPAKDLEVATSMERVMEELSRRVEPAVVNIRRFVRDDAWWKVASSGTETPAGWRVVSDADLLYPGHRPDGGASGFLISEDGYLLTLSRVVVDPKTQREPPVVDVEVGSQHYKADVVSLEPTIDLAILKIAPIAAVPHLTLGDSGKMRTGHWVFAFGNPDGHEKTFVPGIVASPPSRECYQDELSATYLQTSMQVGDGSLGGPLVNLAGEVIGINTRRGDSAAPPSLTTAPGSGYSLPINLSKAIYESLRLRRSRESPWLGISVLFMDEELRRRVGAPGTTGIYIDNVFDPSPASKADIRVGDVLQSIGDQPIESVYDFQRRLYMLRSGDRVKLDLLRNRKPIETTATIEVRPSNATTR